jgi:dihydroorotate dehydrogenase
MFTFAKPFYPLVLATTKSNPEWGHRQMINTLILCDRLSREGRGQWILEQFAQSFGYRDDRLSQELWGLNFPNILGLSAGCDKDAEAAAIWPYLGFGFAELGGVTLHAQAGNPQPRLFRLPLDQAVLNRLGGNNLGAEVMAKTLQETWHYHPRSIPIGINLIKSKITPLEAAAEDYIGSFQYLKDLADYFVINVSSPNTPGLRSLQGSDELEKILKGLQSVNQGEKKLLIKISPDLDEVAISTIIDLAKTYQLSGIVATNTTIQREGLKTQILPKTGNKIQEEAGGLSGMPLRQRSTEIIRFIYQQTQGSIPIIGVGGIFTAGDAWEKITAGASLLQVYTGWIYQGPWMVKDVLQGLGNKLTDHNLTHISQAVGMNASPS